MTAKARASQRGISLVLCPAFDTIEGHPLMLQEKFAIAAKLKGGRGCNRPERAGLPNEVEIAIGMEVMVTFNVLANGTQGHLVDIVLDHTCLCRCVTRSHCPGNLAQGHPADNPTLLHQHTPSQTIACAVLQPWPP